MTQPAAPVPGRHPAYGDLPAGVHGLALRFGHRSLGERHDSRTVLVVPIGIAGAVHGRGNPSGDTGGSHSGVPTLTEPRVGFTFSEIRDTGSRKAMRP
jgi:hypothetical protein